jgi:multisubunit Na+/H+ antiporter MnhG subunit
VSSFFICLKRKLKKMVSNLKKRSNVFAWMNCRKTLRSFGEGFYLRIQGYTSILLMYSFFCVAILNVIAWMQMRHHVSTIYLIMMIVIIIASISIFSISKATKLQHLSSSQRDLIRKEIPTRVLGYVANQNVIGSALGIIATGCFLAVEGFSGSGITYDQNGWFNF